MILFTYLNTVITGRQLAAARALLGLKAQQDLAEFTGTSLGTIRRMEAADTKPVVANTSSYDKVIRALVDVGIEFFNDGAPGVRLHPIPGVILPFPKQRTKVA